MIAVKMRIPTAKTLMTASTLSKTNKRASALGSMLYRHFQLIKGHITVYHGLLDLSRGGVSANSHLFLHSLHSVEKTEGR